MYDFENTGVRVKNDGIQKKIRIAVKTYTYNHAPGCFKVVIMIFHQPQQPTLSKNK